MAVEVVVVPDDERDDEVLEEWVRRTDDPDIELVVASNWGYEEWPWRVSVAVAEFVREGPLEHDLRTAVAAALEEVDGVEAVVEEDTEVWLVSGTPSGEALVIAVSHAVDALGDRLRAHCRPAGRRGRFGGLGRRR
jgi:hypothetical protein